jgi:hypothetical protein
MYQHYIKVILLNRMQLITNEQNLSLLVSGEINTLSFSLLHSYLLFHISIVSFLLAAFC